MSPSQGRRLRVKAQAERDSNGFGLAEADRRIGYLYFWKSKAVCWGRELSAPHKWEPGVVAVSETGSLFCSAGGNPDDGAERWEAVQ